MKKNTYILSVLSLALLLSLTLSLPSCRVMENNAEEEALRVTDALGRTVSLPKNPQRVAALLGSFADVWMLSGGTLCAAADDAWEDFGLDLPHATRLGGAHSPDAERLLAANPDLVLASAGTASNVDLLSLLESAHIPVVYFDVDNFEDYLAMLDVCTTLTGRKDLYEQNGLAIKARIDAVKAQYAADPIPNEQRRILLLRVSATSIKAKGSGGTILGEMLRDMGCVNVADNDRTLLENLSTEAILRENPYHVFVVPMGNDTEAANAALDSMIKENPAWGSLNAIRGGRLHRMDKTLFNLKPNARWAEAYEILYQTLTTS